MTTPPFVRPGDGCIELCTIDGFRGELLITDLRPATALRLAEQLLIEANRLLDKEKRNAR